MKTKLVLILAGLLAVMATILSLQQLAKSSAPQGDDLTADHEPVWNVARIDEKLFASKKHWLAATKAVREHDYRRAARFFHAAKKPIEELAAIYPTNEVRGVTLSDWLMAQQRTYEEHVLHELRWAFDQLASASMRPSVVRNFVQDHAMIASVPEAYARELEVLSAQRALEAENWLRVVLHADHMEETLWPLLEEALVRKWDATTGHRLVFGKSLSYEEGRATWKTLNVHVRHHYARYKSEPRTWKDGWQPPDVAHAQTVEFRMQGAEGEPTTWDNLEKIEVWVKPPTLVTKNESANQQRIIRERLLSQFVDALSKLPEFAIETNMAEGATGP